MKPVPFDYVKPSSIDAACALLDEHPDAVPLAGGQSLLAMLNMRLVTPSHLIDIGGLSELNVIAVGDGWLRLGALVRHCDIANSEQVAAAAPLLAEAVAHIGYPAIRNRGTIGGSLALADPAAELPACVLALGGRLEVVSRDANRRVDATDFFLGPFETALRPGELLVAVQVPVRRPGDRSGFGELARRHGDYALAGLAAHGRFDGARAADLRLAFFGVGDRPVLARAAARALEGASFTGAAIRDAVAKLAEDIEPVGQPGCGKATKLHLAGVLATRVLRGMAP